MRPNKIAVVGPGTVGIPVAALLASSTGTDGSPPPRVVVLQRPSVTSGWKVQAINAGRSPLGAAEPELDTLMASAVARGFLTATHDRDICADADVIIVCVQVDRTGLSPEHGPLLEALNDIVPALKARPSRSRPLLIIESALAPSAMQTVVRPFFVQHGLVDGRDLLLANSPSRAMSGCLVESFRKSDKVVAGLQAESPVLVASLYRRILDRGRPIVTNSLTAEVTSAVENAFRDVRIAFAMEIAKYCERIDVDFRTLRDQVNDVLEWSDNVAWNPSTVPSGAMLLPTVGVGGQALPRDGVLLWWRALEANLPSRNSILLAARGVNDASPASVVRRARLDLGPLDGRRVSVLGAAYRPNSGGARNSPSLVLAGLLRDSGADVLVHDPLVSRTDVNLNSPGLTGRYTHDLDAALSHASLVFVATGHRVYHNMTARLVHPSSGIEGVMDACSLFNAADFGGSETRYSGIGFGRRAPNGQLVRSIVSMYRAVARGVANELEVLIRFLDARYGDGAFNQVDASEVRRLSGTHWLGCRLERPGDIRGVQEYDGFVSGLAQLAVDASPQGSRMRRVPAEHVPPGLWFGNEKAAIADRETPWSLTPKQ